MLHDMEDEATTLAHAIGARVRHERTTRGWTLDQLSAAAGVSRRMLVNVEQGEANPSVGTLLRLAESLGLGLPALVEPPRTQTTRITRNGDGAVLWRGASGGSGVLVSVTQHPDVIELWEWRLEPGERHASEAHRDGTSELLHVHEGRLTVEVEGATLDLNTGDSLAFHGDLPHAYATTGSSPTRFSLAVYEPRVGEPRRTEHHRA